MTILSLSFLGPLKATLNGRSLTLTSRPAQALLTHLAMNREYPPRRDALMALLWPGLPQQSAQVNLRRALYLLRQALPDADEAVPLLLSDRHTIQLNPDAPLDLDVDRFCSLLRGQPEQDQLEDAVALYRGDFLCDFYLPDSAPFEEWAAAHRANLRQQAINAYDSLVSQLMAKEAYEPANAYARQQLAIDPLHERGHRHLMEILVHLGQRSQALSQYDAMCRLLKEELAAVPSPETQALAAQIRRAEMGTAVRPTHRVRGYELKESIGAGAFGVVYRGVQPVIGRDVAIKIIAPEHANRPNFIRRFEAEAQIIARLEHPHIVPLYDYWREPDGAYLVMRYLRGGSLADRLTHGPCDLETAVRLLDQITAALAVAHARGIVHRDIKPGNILLDEDGNAYLSDFGIAKELQRDVRLTQEEMVIGSPAYLAPEQVLGEPVTPQTDLYSLGVVLYEMLTGEHPFADAPLAILFVKHANEPLPSTSSRRPDLPPAVDAVIQRATAKTSAGRYPDVRALAQALQSAVDGVQSTAAAPDDCAALRNPYKGLRPFEEADADDFFGRHALVEQLLDRLAKPDDDSRFLAVVGPSGCGKSSVVMAGLLPALRRGALPGSADWFVVQMTPGARPLDKLEIGLLRIAARQPAGLGEQLRRDAHGLLRAARLVLPDDDATLLLVIDQFEELYTAVDPTEQDHVLQLLTTAIGDPDSPLRVVITLRADFYDRPLLHAGFGRLIKQRTAVVLPLTTAELTRAVAEPAVRAGAELESGLAATIVADVAEAAGALPMLQYALTELFAQRDGRRLTRDAYQSLGGVSGALASCADEVFSDLGTAAERETARQLFLRLVTLGEGVEDTRRRILRSELEAIQTGTAGKAVTAIVDTFGQARLLTFNHDPETREPTVEVAHEALLRAWPRLRTWLDESRDDVRLQRLLNHATTEWLASNEHPGFLLRGSRLDQFSTWITDTTLALTHDEQAFLDASLAARAQRRQAEAERQAKEAALEQRSRRFLRALAAVLSMAFVGALILSLYAFGQRREALTQQQEALLAYGQSLAAHADNAMANGDTATGLALALAATDMDDPSPLSQRSLREAAYAPGPRRLYRVAELFPDVNGRIYSLAMSPVAHEALIGFEDGSLILWDVTAEAKIHRLAGHVGIVRAIAFSPDGQTALSGGSDHAVILWDLATGREIRRFAGHDGWVRAVAFSPDGQTAVSGGFAGDTVSSVAEPGQLLLWDLASGEEIRRFTGHPSGVVAAAFTPDGRTIMASSGMFANVDNAYALKLWNAATGELVYDFNVTYTGDNFSLAISPDGRTALTGTGNDQLVQWDIGTGEQLGAFEGHEGNMITSVAMTRDGRLSLSGDANGVVLLRDQATGTSIMRTAVQMPTMGGWHADDQPVLNLAIGPAGRTALSSAGDGTLVLWDLMDAAAIRYFAGHKSPSVVDVTFTPDGERVLTSEWGDAFGFLVSDSSTMHLWDVKTGEHIRSFEGHTTVIMAAVSADGLRALAGSQDGTIRLWDLETGGELRQILAHTEGVFSVALSPDGRWALSGSMANDLPDSGVSLWDLETGQLVQRLATQGHFTKLVFHPDGQTAYSNVIDPESNDDFGLYDLETGQLIRGYATGACCTDFELHPNGETVFLANNTGAVIEWDLETGRELRSFGFHPSSRTVIEVSSDGRLLLISPAGFTKGQLSLWDLETDQEIRRFDHPGTCCIDIEISPDGRTAIIPAGRSGAPVLWDLTLPADLDDVRAWIAANRYVRELRCEERELYRIAPLCE